MGTKRALRHASTAASSSRRHRASRIPGAGQQLRDTLALGGGVGWRRSAGRWRPPRSARKAPARLCRASPCARSHMVSKQSARPRRYSPRRPASRCRLRLQAANRARDIDCGEVGFDGRAGRAPCADTPPDSRTRAGGWDGVGGRQRIVGEPGIGDEAAGAGGAHHVAAPECVDAEDRVAHQWLVPVRPLLAS